MSRKIIFFRHAEAEWDGTIGKDHARKLTQKGKDDAALMGKALNKTQQPQYIISSSAVRAHTTAKLAESAGKWGSAIHATDDLYNIQPDNVIDVIVSIPPFYKCAMLVGHEPTWSELVKLFIGGANLHMSTASMACIGFDTDVWSEVDYGVGKLLWFIQPAFFHDQ